MRAPKMSAGMPASMVPGLPPGSVPDWPVGSLVSIVPNPIKYYSGYGAIFQIKSNLAQSDVLVSIPDVPKFDPEFTFQPSIEYPGGAPGAPGWSFIHDPAWGWHCVVLPPGGSARLYVHDTMWPPPGARNKRFYIYAVDKSTPNSAVRVPIEIDVMGNDFSLSVPKAVIGVNGCGAQFGVTAYDELMQPIPAYMLDRSMIIEGLVDGISGRVYRADDYDCVDTVTWISFLFDKNEMEPIDVPLNLRFTQCTRKKDYPFTLKVAPCDGDFLVKTNPSCTDPAPLTLPWDGSWSDKITVTVERKQDPCRDIIIDIISEEWTDTKYSSALVCSEPLPMVIRKNDTSCAFALKNLWKLKAPPNPTNQSRRFFEVCATTQDYPEIRRHRALYYVRG